MNLLICRYVKFAVLVITFLLVALSDSTNLRATRSRKLPKMVCTTQESTFQKRRLTNEIGTSKSENRNMERSEIKSIDTEINYGSSFWLRNACHKGFVVVKEQSKVLAQHEGLSEHDNEGKNTLKIKLSRAKYYRFLKIRN